MRKHLNTYFNYFHFFLSYHVLKIKREDYGNKSNHVKRLDAEYFSTHREYQKTDFINYREVIKRFEIDDKHYYIIVPCTFNANETSAFVLRMFCDFNLKIKLL